MNFLSTVILLCISSLDATREVLTWAEADTIFPNHLQHVFGSQYTLKEAQEFTHATAKADGKLSIGCIAYEAGQDLAFRARSENVPLLPILVSSEEDRMCFLLVDSTFSTNNRLPAGEEFDIVLVLPQSLKLHVSVSDALISMTNGESVKNANVDLNIFYRPEYFGESEVLFSNETVLITPTPSEFHFSEYLTAVASSSARDSELLFEEFFWTAPSTLLFFEEADSAMRSSPGFQMDEQIFRLWEKLQAQFMESYDPNVGEKCPLSAITATYLRGQIQLDIAPIMSMKEPTRAAACLSFIAASFATAPSVNHVAITNRVELLNYRARSIQQSADPGSALANSPYTEMGLRGDGQIIAIADTGVDRTSCYFSDPKGMVAPSNLDNPKYDLTYRKVIQYNFNGCGDNGDEYAGHGTHVSGTAIGSVMGVDITSVKGQYDGVAPNGKLSFADLGKPGTGLCIPNSKALYDPAYTAGARVNSNSWGNLFNGAGYYATEDVDKYLFERTDSSVFFAAGNSGSQGSGSITVQGTGKSVVAIGSGESTLGGPDIDNVAFYSSKGPTYDNRIKPDVVAPGDSLMSVLSNGDAGATCGTTSKTGTSMATPAAAGIALLVRQYFLDASGKFWLSVCVARNRFCKRFNPSGVLVKGVLLHSTSPMDLYHGGGSNDISLGPPPDYLQGYGRVTLANVLPLKGVYNMNLFVEDLTNIEENSEISYAIRIKSSKEPLRATLVWYDPPSVSGTTTTALLNNLDLTVTAPSRKKYYGNGGTGADVKNPNEKVIVDTPEVGTWKVTVSAKALPSTGNQLFSVIITSNGRVYDAREEAHVEA